MAAALTTAGAAFASAASYVNLVGAAAKGVAEAVDQLGVIEDEVTVIVEGAPNCDRGRLYHMAASIGFGLVQKLGVNAVDVTPFLGVGGAVLTGLGIIEGVMDLPPPGMIAISYDAASNNVTFKLSYKTSLVNTLVTAAFIPKRPNAAALSTSLPVLTGPANSTRGGNWNFRGPLIGEDVLPLVGVSPLKVPDFDGVYTGRTFLTKSNTPINPPVPSNPFVALANPKWAANVNNPGPPLNPRPYGDNRSRAGIVQLLYSALSTPGTDRGMVQQSGPDAANFALTYDTYRGS